MGDDDIMDYMLLEDVLFSSDSSESDEDMNARYKKSRVKNFVSEVVDLYTDREFRENFRMNRNTFDYVLNLIKDEISSSVDDRGRHTIDAKKQLLLCLWYLATPDSYRSICSKFDVGKATGLRSVRKVTNALFRLSSQIITWPTGNYLEEVKVGFRNMGFPDTIGCIDGSYIPIPLPKENGRAYICRKNFSCIILQGVCDHRLLFTHCYVGEVGSTHDATVLKRSEIWEYMNINNLNKFPNGTHLLGDKAYPCLPQLITPYKENGPLTPEQRNFNYRLSSARSTIERTFGLLKKRQRSMKFLDVIRLDWIPKYVISCCVLHNICIIQNDLDVDIGYNLMEVNDQDDNIELDERELREMKRLGREKRDRICRELAEQM